MNRKKFLLNSGVVAGSALLSSCLTIANAPNEEGCELTGFDAQGPFFVKGSSQVINLNTQNLEGTPMLVKGTVYSGAGTNTPLSGVKIDVWHCDNAGAYHPNGSGKVGDYPVEEVTLRGFVLTDENGQYSFKSIFPGLYGSRARHIHYKLNVAQHKELVTQSYFLGDDRIPHDSLAKRAADCRILAHHTNEHGEVVLTMDFNLRN